MADRKNNHFVCAFCGRNSKQSKELYIPSMYEGLAICSDCSRKIAEVMSEAETDRSGKKGSFQLNVPAPAEIKAELDKYVIGPATIAATIHPIHLKMDIKRCLREGLCLFIVASFSLSSYIRWSVIPALIYLVCTIFFREKGKIGGAAMVIFLHMSCRDSWFLEQ